MDALKKVFTPEFLNRLDAIVTFKELDQSMILRVAQKFIGELQLQLQKKNVELVVSSQVPSWLAQTGYDKVYGARPMARVVDEHLKKPLADELLFGRLKSGGRVHIEMSADSKLEFQFTEALTV